ncbi:DUF4150 domain-containing protein [Roseibium sp. M-1]
MFVNNQNGCMSLGLMDVCNTIVGPATVPIPYVNIAVSTLAVPNVATVFVGGGLAHNLLTTTEITSGDETGTAMGIVSATIIGEAMHVTSSAMVFMGVAPATRLTSTTMQNSINSVGMTLTPAQFTFMALS